MPATVDAALIFGVLVLPGHLLDQGIQHGRKADRASASTDLSRVADQGAVVVGIDDARRGRRLRLARRR